MTTRQVKLDGVVYDVPRCVHRDNANRRWRVSFDRVGQPLLRKCFADGPDPAAALHRAIQWAQHANVRKPFHGIPLHRTANRRLTLCCREIGATEGVEGWKKFSLEFLPSKSAWKRGWMTIFLGTDRTLSQERIEIALAQMAGRVAMYRENAARTCAREAVDARGYEMAPPVVDHPYVLIKQDIAEWTGMARFIDFSPRAWDRLTG